MSRHLGSFPYKSIEVFFYTPSTYKSTIKPPVQVIAAHLPHKSKPTIINSSECTMLWLFEVKELVVAAATYQ